MNGNPQEVIFRKLRMAVSQAVPNAILVKIVEYPDIFLDSMVYSLQAEIFAHQVGTGTSKASFQVPKTWAVHFPDAAGNAVMIYRADLPIDEDR